MNEEAQMIRISLPGEETEPKMVATWQYIWPDENGNKNICVLFSAIAKDGTAVPQRFMLLGDCDKGTAKECLLSLVAVMEEELKKACEEDKPQVALSDRNPKRKMGFLK